MLIFNGDTTWNEWLLWTLKSGFETKIESQCNRKFELEIAKPGLKVNSLNSYLILITGSILGYTSQKCLTIRSGWNIKTSVNKRWLILGILNLNSVVLHYWEVLCGWRKLVVGLLFSWRNQGASSIEVGQLQPRQDWAARAVSKHGEEQFEEERKEGQWYSLLSISLKFSSSQFNLCKQRFLKNLILLFLLSTSL